MTGVRRGEGTGGKGRNEVLPGLGLEKQPPMASGLSGGWPARVGVHRWFSCQKATLGCPWHGWAPCGLWGCQSRHLSLGWNGLLVLFGARLGGTGH